MKELLDEIVMLYKYFNNENYTFFAIFLISIIFIFITEKDKKIKDFFVYYSIVIIAIIWNPICIYVLNKFINIGSMYRIYYMLPFCITIAYATTRLIEKNNKIFKKLIIMVAIVTIIIISGKCIFNKNNTIEVSNYYKLPDETVEVAYLISNDNETEYKKAIVPYGMSSQIRQVCTNVELVYSRIISNPKDENGNSLPHDTDDASNYPPVKNLNEGNVEYIVDLCNKSNVNYIVFNQATILSDNIEKYGWELYKQTLSYNIYRMVEKEK